MRGRERRVDWPVEGRRGRYNPRLDEIRSETGGDGRPTNETAVTIVTVPTGKAFHIRAIQMSASTPAAVVRLYASTAGGTRRTLLVNALAAGQTRAVTELQGWIVIASTARAAQVLASVGPAGGAIAAFVRVAGVLRNRLSGETTTS